MDGNPQPRAWQLPDGQPQPRAWHPSNERPGEYYGRDPAGCTAASRGTATKTSRHRASGTGHRTRPLVGGAAVAGPAA